MQKIKESFFMTRENDFPDMFKAVKTEE